MNENRLVKNKIIEFGSRIQSVKIQFKNQLSTVMSNFLNETVAEEYLYGYYSLTVKDKHKMSQTSMKCVRQMF